MVLKLRYIILVVGLIIVMLMAFSGVSLAIPPPLQIPQLPSTNSGGSSGGSSGSGGSTPAFVPYTISLNSSDGTTIGSLDGINSYTVNLKAEKNASLGNDSYDLVYTGVLNQRPPNDCWLDINFEGADQANIPADMSNAKVLAVVNITHFTGSGWDMNSNSVNLALTVTGPNEQDQGSGVVYYLVDPEGANYLLQGVSPSTSGSNTLTFNVASPDDNGLFTLLAVNTAVSTPTPTPIISPTPIPTSVPSDSGTPGVALLLATLAAGVVIGATLIFAVQKIR
jgi:hypothetical protein